MPNDSLYIFCYLGNEDERKVIVEPLLHDVKELSFLGRSVQENCAPISCSLYIVEFVQLSNLKNSTMYRFGDPQRVRSAAL